MALYYGFYNSVNGDRKYNATQFCDIFDGVINDGVFDNVAGIFGTVPGSGLQVLVKTGRAWFNKTWNYNDAAVPINLSAPDVVFDRIDTIVLEVDARDSGRVNSLKVIKGTPSTNPIAPALSTEEKVYQHPLSNVRVRANTDDILASDITILVGTSQCPFVTAILQTTNIDVLYANWEQQFTTWFDNLKAQLNDNVVANLQAQIDAKPNKATRVVREYIFTSGTWYPPKDLKVIKSITCLGGGGRGGTGGSAASNGNEGCGGGGAGGNSGALKTLQNVTITPNVGVACTIGAGGSYGSSNGGSTSFGSYLSAAGGYAGGGGGSGASSDPGAGGGGVTQPDASKGGNGGQGAGFRNHATVSPSSGAGGSGSGGSGGAVAVSNEPSTYTTRSGGGGGGGGGSSYGTGGTGGCGGYGDMQYSGGSAGGSGSNASGFGSGGGGGGGGGGARYGYGFGGSGGCGSPGLIILEYVLPYAS